MLDDLSVLSDSDEIRVTTSDGDFRVTVYDDDVQVRVDAAIAINGRDGAGVLPGGLTGYLLGKVTDTDFDTAWFPPQVPIGGLADQVLTKIGPDPFDAEWRDVPPGVPTGGDTNAVLTKFSSDPFDMVWSILPDPNLRVAKTGDVMSGPLELPADPTLPLQAATKQYTDSKAPLVSPAFQDTPTAPTPPPADNSSRLATTGWMQSELNLQLPFFLLKAGGTMTGVLTLAGDPAAALQAAPKQYVDAQVVAPYALEFDTISRTNLSRWNDHLSITEISAVDVTGTASTADVAILGAWNKALTRDRRSSIHLPAGNLRLGTVLELLNNFAAGIDNIEIIGEGMYATNIIGPTTASDIIKLGSYFGAASVGEATAAQQSGNITFRDLTLSPGSVHTGALVAIRNCSNCRFINVRFNLGLKGVTFEDAPFIAIKRCSNHFFINCQGTCQNGGIIFYPTAVESFHVDGGKWGGGVGRRFFVHDKVDKSCDGIYITGGYFEQFDSAVESLGGGMVNVEIQAKQFDRSPVFIKVQPPAGVPGLNREWVVHDTQFKGGSFTEDAIIWDASLGTSGAICEALNINNCSFHQIKKRILYCGEGSGVMSGIVARSCGTDGTEVIRLGTAGNFELVGIQSHRSALDTTLGFPTHGIVYDGPSTGKRGHTACRFWDATVAQFSGTP